MRTKNIIIRFVWLLFLGVAIPVTINAQQLLPPQKNCEGAKAIPEDLKSWCEPPYYNECECQFEKAMQEYRTKKKNYEEQYKKYNADKDQKLRNIGRLVAQGNQATAKLMREDDVSQQSVALSKYNEAIREYQSLRNDYVNIDRISRILGITVDSKVEGLPTPVAKDLDNVRQRYQEALNWKASSKGADVSLSNNLDDFLSGKQSNSPSQKKNDLDDFLSGKYNNKSSGNNSADGLDDFLHGNSINSNTKFKITSKNGLRGVEDENGNVLIPFKEWEIVSYDQISKTSEIREQIKSDSKYNRFGETRPCINYYVYRVYRVNSKGESIGMENTFFNIWGNDHCNLMLGDGYNMWRNKNSADLQRGKNWVESEKRRLTNEFIRLGYKQEK